MERKFELELEREIVGINNTKNPRKLIIKFDADYKDNANQYIQIRGLKENGNLLVAICRLTRDQMEELAVTILYFLKETETGETNDV